MTEQELEEIIAQAAREEWEELDLKGEGIEVLPAAIGNCKNLKQLILGRSLKGKIISNGRVRIFGKNYNDSYIAILFDT